MSTDLTEIDPTQIAAILYGPRDDVDTLLADFAQELRGRGERIGGIVQRNLKDAAGKTGMLALDLRSGRQISICQPLGSGAMACKLDAGGLAEAAVAVSRAVGDHVELIVINKFSTQEACGRGLRNEFAEVILAGVPLLTAVPEKCLQQWKAFTGDIGTTLLCERQVVDAWWRDVSARRAASRSADATCRSSRPTT